MAINKKGKRKITVNGKAYLWWMLDEYSQTAFDGLQVKIITEDLHLFFQYGLAQFPEKRFLVLGIHDKMAVHIYCPQFENEEGILLPSGISELIKWSSIKPDNQNIRVLRHAWANQKWNRNTEGMAVLYEEILKELNS